MTIDPETLMACADGELDPLSVKRVERAIAEDPALADEVARHRALRMRLETRFAPVAAEPVPDQFTALLDRNVVSLPVSKPRAGLFRWYEALALAACLTIGVMVGQGWQDGPIVTHDGRPYAAGGLPRALDTQLAANTGTVKLSVSFRDREGGYCRVFTSVQADGIACRSDDGWALRQLRSGAAGGTTDYRQAGSSDGALMADAQAMMAGEPLDAVAETKARDRGWH